MKKIFLFAICVLLFYSVGAYDFEHNGFYYNILSLSDLTVELTCGGEENEYKNTTPSYSGDVTIPQITEYANKTFKVIQINPYAFINCSIATLTIPETIESIDASGDTMGMYGKFSNLVIEDGDKPIKCFRALITGDVTNTVYLGRDIEGYQESSVVYDRTRGGSYKTITFGSKLSSIPDYCCSGCPNLTDIYIPSAVKSVERAAFEACTALTIVQGECVEELDRDAFAGCSKLTSFDFPSLRTIGVGCFSYCTSLKDVVLPLGAITIYGDSYGGAFYGCTSLESIVIPSTVVKMGLPYDDDNSVSKIFVGCSSLKTLSIANLTPIAFSESNLDMLSFLSTTLKVPVGAKKAYSEAEGWKNFSNIVEDATLVGDIYTVYYDNSYSYAGSLELEFDDALEPYDQYRFAKNGTDITINIKPEYGYKIKSLNINGVDVTSEIVSNTYTFTVAGSMTISASFTYDDAPGPQEPIYLSIKQADNGCVKMKVYKWETFSFVISPSDGWKIHSVSFNGQDVTNALYDGTTFYTPEIYDNSELVVAFEADEAGISQMVYSGAKVFASSGNIIVKDASASENILICDEAGHLLANCKGNNAEQAFSVSKTGVYIVKVGSKTIKIAM